MKRVLLVLSPGFEEIEAVTPLDLLRRAGIETVAASAGEALEVRGGRGLGVAADRMLADCRGEAFDMLVLPGGPGVDRLRRNAEVLALVRAYRERNLPVAAICAAPLVLADAGVIAMSRVTSFPSARPEVEARAREYAEDRVVVDGGIITSRGAGTAEEFSLKLVEILSGAEAADTVRRQVLAR